MAITNTYHILSNEKWGQAIATAEEITCTYCGDAMSSRRALKADGHWYCSSECVLDAADLPLPQEIRARLTSRCTSLVKYITQLARKNKLDKIPPVYAKLRGYEKERETAPRTRTNNAHQTYSQKLRLTAEAIAVTLDLPDRLS